MAERIIIKSDHQVEMMRKAGKLTGEARAYAASLIKPGVTTKEIDRAIYKFITSNGGYPSFYHLYGFRGSACISVNDEIIHGVPGSRRLEEGDIVSVDVGACVGDYQLDKHGVAVGGYHGDCAGTFAVGHISDDAKHLIEVTEQSFWAGIKQAKAGNRVSAISAGVQEVAEAAGLGIVREFVGHGVGRAVHEAPEVPNYVSERHPGGNPRLFKNMVLAVEPMLNAGTERIKLRTMPDGWEVVLTADHKYAAHYENTILITDGEPEVLTWCGD